MEHHKLGVKAGQLLESAEGRRREKNREAGFKANLTHFEAARDGILDKEALLKEHKENPGRMGIDKEMGQRIFAQIRKHRTFIEGHHCSASSSRRAPDFPNSS